MRRGGVSCVLVAAILGSAAPASASPAPFRVGVASVVVNPTVPVTPGGVGLGGSSPTTDRHGDFTTRAIYISNGRRAVVLASTDSFGQFAAYDGLPDLGLSAIRAQAAGAIDAEGFGPHIDATDIMTQSTHAHSAASVIGLWGTPPVSYMKEMAAAEEQAIVKAAQSAQPAYLEYGSIDASYLNSLNLTTQDAYRGFQPDGQLSILRAVNRSTGATIGAYVNVPVHPIITLGLPLKIIGPDFDGTARKDIEDAIGGTVVMGPGTLGRQDPPWIQSDPARLSAAFDTLNWFGGEVASLSMQALENARFVTSDRIASAETTMKIVLANPLILSLMYFHHFGEAEQLANGVNPGFPSSLDRSESDPWLSGNVLGTPLTALRIGGLLYLSQPGEAFPDVRLNLARLISGPSAVTTLDQSQDMLGYYFPAWEGTAGNAFSPANDHTLFNVSPNFAEKIVDTELTLARQVGFGSGQAGVLSTFPLPSENFLAAGEGGIQALASPSNGDDCPFTTQLRAIYTAAGQTDDIGAGHDPRGDLPAGTVSWDLGGGRTVKSGYYTYHAVNATPVGAANLTEGFGVGAHSVTVSGVEQTGGTVSFTIPVVVHPALVATASARRSDDGTWTLTIGSTGGDGTIVKRAAAFSDGTPAEGRVVTHRFADATSAPGVDVTVTDATGATASVHLALDGDSADGASAGCAAPAAG